MKILLTGARGMVGQNILEHDRAPLHEWLTPGRQELDLSNRVAVEQYMRGHAIDLVVHCAGKVGGIQANMREPVQFLLENMDIGRNVIGAAQAAVVPRLLNLSSSCIYPRDRSDALTEDLVLKGELEPTNEGYALAKIMALRLCEYINSQYAGFQYKTLIPCNLYGRHDKFDSASSHLLPAVIHKVHSAMSSGQGEVEIWGSGEARREFMFAGDLADAVLAAIDRFDELPPLMNVGLGHDHSINDYYRAAAEVIGYKGAFVHDLARPVGMQRKLVSTTLLERWGWKPKHSLREGIRRTYDYYMGTLK